MSWSSVLVHLRLDEAVLAFVCVTPLLLVLAPLARCVSGRALAEEHERSVARVEQTARTLDAQASSVLKMLERNAAASEHALSVAVLTGWASNPSLAERRLTLCD